MLREVPNGNIKPLTKMAYCIKSDTNKVEGEVGGGG